MASIRGVVVGLLGLAQAAAAAHRMPLTLMDLPETLSARGGDGAGGRVAAQKVDLTALYPTRTIAVPLDHFRNDSIYEPHSEDTLNLRYWFDASYYKAGGPVIVLQGGETSGKDRLPFLHKGILAILAEATGGLGVVLEHRYYGASFPATDLSTENLRFLSTDQALADMAYFAKNVVFDGLEGLSLTAPHVPYIAYGGSYAGALAAFVRKVYPDIYWGAISSSGVTKAIYEYWEYFEAARLFGPQDCVVATQKLTHIVDNILTNKADTDYVQRLKTVFGLPNITRSNDFANTLTHGISTLQNTNWDPAPDVGSDHFYQYCNTVSSNTLLYPSSGPLKTEVQELITVAGYGAEMDTMTTQLLNYIGYIDINAVKPCARRSQSQDTCFSAFGSWYGRDDRSQTWRSWPYQVCTEWGYLTTGSGVPITQLPLISRLIDLNYTSITCQLAFNITTPSKVEVVNKHGGFDISYPRLAIIDGEKDPWRQATPHAIHLPERESTTSEPFLIIKDGVHHWDENGLFPNETTAELPPPPIVEVQKAEVEFVKAWLEEWKTSRGDHLVEIREDL
ncbi:peptidase S28 [Lasiosphaeris hirsuta]|uniref:Peptidase S28 n=1 Tax=Lasiosphaeris hirsuta TaxID=260670 RepID=A0AA40B9Q3_9PEZI|nr:peptidase S28 [Lasiosphaeris hirsuta]